MFGFVERKFQERKGKLLSGFSTGIEKGISVGEFEEKYSSGYDVFDVQGLSSYEKAALEKGITKGEILEEFNKLERVVVTEGNKSVVLFVKETE